MHELVIIMTGTSVLSNVLLLPILAIGIKSSVIIEAVVNAFFQAQMTLSW